MAFLSDLLLVPSQWRSNQTSCWCLSNGVGIQKFDGTLLELSNPMASLTPLRRSYFLASCTIARWRYFSFLAQGSFVPEVVLPRLLSLFLPLPEGL